MGILIAAPLLLLFICWVIYFHHTVPYGVPYGADKVKKRPDSTKRAG